MSGILPSWLSGRAGAFSIPEKTTSPATTTTTSDVPMWMAGEMPSCRTPAAMKAVTKKPRLHMPCARLMMRKPSCASCRSVSRLTLISSAPARMPAQKNTGTTAIADGMNGTTA